MYQGSINHREYWNVIERSVDRMRGPRRYLLSFYLLGLTMNQLGASLLNNVETLFIQTVNRPGTRGGGLISDTESVRGSVNRLTSAYIFRLFRNSLRSILRRFTGYGTASKGEGISGVSIRGSSSTT